MSSQSAVSCQGANWRGNFCNTQWSVSSVIHIVIRRSVIDISNRVYCNLVRVNLARVKSHQTSFSHYVTAERASGVVGLTYDRSSLPGRRVSPLLGRRERELGRVNTRSKHLTRTRFQCIIKISKLVNMGKVSYFDVFYFQIFLDNIQTVRRRSIKVREKCHASHLIYNYTIRV